MRLLELLDNNKDETPKTNADSEQRTAPHVQEPKNYGTARAMAKDPAGAIPNARIVSQIRNTDTYMQYRYGIALAAAAAQQGKGDEFEQESDWSENIGLVGYTDADLEVIKGADKLMGVSSDQISDGASHEQDDVNTKSAISGAENI